VWSALEPWSLGKYLRWPPQSDRLTVRMTLTFAIVVVIDATLLERTHLASRRCRCCCIKLWHPRQAQHAVKTPAQHPAPPHKLKH